MVREILVVDTDIVIDYLRQENKKTLLKNLLKQSHIRLLLPAIVLTELWRGKSIKQSQEKQKVEKLLRRLKITVAGKNISKTAGELLRKYSHLMLADALVAATAIDLKGKLVTLNEKHFQAITNLSILNTKF